MDQGFIKAPILHSSRPFSINVVSVPYPCDRILCRALGGDLHFPDKMLLAFVSTPPSHPDVIIVFTRDQNTPRLNHFQKQIVLAGRKPRWGKGDLLVSSRYFCTFFFASLRRTTRTLTVKHSVSFIGGVCVSIWRQENIEVLKWLLQLDRADLENLIFLLLHEFSLVFFFSPYWIAGIRFVAPTFWLAPKGWETWLSVRRWGGLSWCVAFPWGWGRRCMRNGCAAPQGTAEATCASPPPCSGQGSGLTWWHRAGCRRHFWPPALCWSLLPNNKQRWVDSNDCAVSIWFSASKTLVF